MNLKQCVFLASTFDGGKGRKGSNCRQKAHVGREVEWHHQRMKACNYPTKLVVDSMNTSVLQDVWTAEGVIASPQFNYIMRPNEDPRRYV